MLPAQRIRVRVQGLVQGVGFRPFVYGLATEYGVTGFVGNDSGGVFIEAEGHPPALDGFVAGLRRQAPPLALVEHVIIEVTEPLGEAGFRIVPSEGGARRDALVAPDTATCDDCLAELSDPACRRYRHPFANCTNCGPRFTIVTGVPYDRDATTMAGFAMCAECEREYRDPVDRRFHAQPVCCPACGPTLRLLGADGRPMPGDPVTTAVEWLQRGCILAVKGLGGYHLAVLADHERAVATLRARKRREARPFAVMAPDLAAADALVHLEPEAIRLLTGSRSPIVLAPRREDAAVAEAVAPGSRDLGVMLPHTPLHHLLAAQVAQPFVLTSGNLSDEPIACQDADALRRLAPVADGFLLHDRRIHVRADDSLVRVFRGREMPIRRSRGYVPAPVAVPWMFPRPVLACGAELKNTFCVAKGTQAFLSHHIGDLENYETLRSFTEGIDHFCRIFGVRPAVVAHDLHPEYLSTKYALDREDCDLLAVQHHHAHIASCLADNGHEGPVIGVAFDGLGYGEDGTLWGGELLVADLETFRRAGHLEPVPMPGGAAAVRQPWRMAAAYLDQIYGDALPDLPVTNRHKGNWATAVSMARTGTNAPLTSSAGRLFDAVAALTGVRDVITYEGQAAAELEARVDPAETGAYSARLGEDTLIIKSGDLVHAVAEDVLAGVAVERIAARFHNGLAAVVVRAVRELHRQTGLDTVALSGGVFQNVVLLERLAHGLEQAGLTVLLHHRVPPGDGGISLGQAVIAAARERATT
ncbi:carbamoyltransferase [Acrocarpospora phusangensis]|uniref:Carbamoyltransferase n=1 Tax=Acrocarpospora phusangensis TaxID=1070424 RepID=A0A919UME5_9ACTN|nr:carbamoyltransferase HypF [Acrocarpospora phusangensis]GIH23252.1 carbamoyltransferase [Acrocarpospora phusangensis]